MSTRRMRYRYPCEWWVRFLEAAPRKALRVIRLLLQRNAIDSFRGKVREWNAGNVGVPSKKFPCAWQSNFIEASETVKTYLDFLKKNNDDILTAYLLGSYAKGNFNEDSDIDLAVVMKNLSNSFLMQVELMKISRKFDTRIEPHPFDERDFDTSNPFANEILKSGTKIF